MSLLFSRQCEYALQAVSYLALHPRGRLVSIRELTKRLKIPYHFLGKILQGLVQKRILISHKGHSGGFALALPPEDISFYDIIKTIDGTQFKHQCAMGFSECSSESPCAIHDQWEKSRNELYKLFSGRNLAEMANAMNKPGYRTLKL
ncbi:MAG: Rrf2 family transcriptional regulator [Ignavibacteriae bacterium]|nr:MAG: Rrf2 family transcriptional regulator [Ignavibacteriota bacterium]